MTCGSMNNYGKISMIRCWPSHARRESARKSRICQTTAKIPSEWLIIHQLRPFRARKELEHFSADVADEFWRRSKCWLEMRDLPASSTSRTEKSLADARRVRPH